MGCYKYQIIIENIKVINHVNFKKLGITLCNILFEQNHKKACDKRN